MKGYETIGSLGDSPRDSLYTNVSLAPFADRIPLQFPRRMVDSSELSDNLRSMQNWGVSVPILNFSPFMPDYVKTRADGTEVYKSGGEVPPGHVIDTHGNVVNLDELNRQMWEAIVPRERSSPSSDYDYLSERSQSDGETRH